MTLLVLDEPRMNSGARGRLKWKKVFGLIGISISETTHG
jgi:hypothetical protein